MMKKLIHIFAFLLLVVFVSTAKEVSKTTALKVGANYVASQSLLKSEPLLTLVYEANLKESAGLRSSVSPLYYIYNVGENDGFVIVAGDDRVNPILAYSGEGNFVMDDMPENLSKWLEFYKNEINFAIQNGFAQTATIEHKWANLLKGETTAFKTDVLLETASWNQGDPYNQFAPLDGGKASVTGCVATAMGIVMKYYAYPEKGTGTISYRTGSKEIQITHKLGEIYAWDKMTDTYTENSSEEAKNAVAQLMYDCGVTVEMDYTSTSSGAYSHKVIDALVNNFGYDKGLYQIPRNSYTASEWESLMKNELSESRPVLYGGVTSDTEAHFFVVDGYNSDNYFHINWGWSGYGNAYFLLSSLDLAEQGIGGSEDNLAFNYEQDAIIGIQKPIEGSEKRYEVYFVQKGGMSEEDELDYFGMKTDVEKIETGKEFELSFSYISEYGLQAFEGYIAFAVIDSDEELKEALIASQVTIPSGRVLTGSPPLTIKGQIDKGDCLVMLYGTDLTNLKFIRGDNNTVWKYPIDGSPVTGNEQIIKSSVEVLTYEGSKQFLLRSGSDEQMQQVQVYSMLGGIMANARIPSGNEYYYVFDGSYLPAGTYIIVVKTSKQDSSHKIILK